MDLETGGPLSRNCPFLGKLKGIAEIIVWLFSTEGLFANSFSIDGSVLFLGIVKVCIAF
jgi:hypothetical protein